jgi:hypothetical protein
MTIPMALRFASLTQDRLDKNLAIEIRENNTLLLLVLIIG